MKIAIITCYDQNDHIRARVLRKGFADVPGVETIVVKNKMKGLLRYIEVPLRLVWTKCAKRPDAYVITFRGYEMLPFVLLIKGRKPLVFDEMVNAIEYLYEHKTIRPDGLLDRLFKPFYRKLLMRCAFVLADTPAHAEISSALSGVPIKKYRAVPIGTEEALFYPDAKAAPNQPGKFEVFYYGVMVPLHGLEYFLKAAVLLKDHPDIIFRVGGDKGRATQQYDTAIRRGARIMYQPWFEYQKELPRLMRGASLAVGGPFGGSAQAQFVITTKTFQALACGVPVLVGRNKVNAAFKDKQNALVVPQGDAQAIADAILWAYRHPKQLQKMSVSGRELYETSFSDAIVARTLGQMVKEL